LYKSFKVDFFKAFCAKLVWSFLVIFCIWYFVFNILDFIKAKDKGTPTDYMDNYEFYMCAGFFVTMFVLSVGIQQMGMFSSILALKVKASLTTTIFKKMIARDEYGSSADIVSLVAKDVEKLAETCLSIQFLWSGIAETCAVFAVLLYLMGSTILPGLGLMCVFLPLQYMLGLIVAFRKKALAKVSDQRITLMSEILRGIKLIKIYGWEASFFEKLNLLRDQEGRMLVIINAVKSAILGLTFCLPPLMCMVIFGTQEATGTIEKSVMVFSALSFFNTLRVPFSKLPKSLRDLLDSLACLGRIQSFLLEPDLPVVDDLDKVKSTKTEGLIISNASLSYGVEGQILLTDININIPAGTFMMVAGPVAGGKSNLLKSILGELTIRKGEIHVSSSKAYVPQTPWTALGTVKDNIVFGKPYDDALYRQVLHACALEPDLKIMAKGDQTWIGERGGNLSGGQKQRIALARAAYSRADIYVLDSPLSAVDMYTCQHIMKYCIQDLMIGGGGTVILATHQTELFAVSDHLVVMKDCEMVYNNKYTYDGIKHLFPNFCGDTVEVAEKHAAEATQHSKEDDIAIFTDKSPTVIKKNSPEAKVHVKFSPHAHIDHKVATEVDEESKKQNVYIWYIHRQGTCWFLFATWVFIFAQLIRVYSDTC
jgi:ATP-binding cassette, subfamily C (CFTR/MRP), member 1